MLLFDVERSGLLLLEATVNETRSSATIVMGNLSYPVWMDAVDRMSEPSRSSSTHNSDSFSIVEEEGHRLRNSIRIRRPSLDYE